VNRQDVLARVVGAAVATVGSAGLVTAIGGATLWARFHAAELPADQAVAAVPNQELVVVGAVTLVGFVAAGIAALVAVYAMDRCGEPGPRTRRGLVTLAAAEVAAAVLYRQFSAWLTVAVLLAVALASVVLYVIVEDVAEFFKARRQTDRPSTLTALQWWARERLFRGLALLEAIRRGVVLLLLVLLVLIVGGVLSDLPLNDWIWLAAWGLAFIVLARPWNALRRDREALRRALGTTVLLVGVAALLRFEETLGLVTLAALALAGVNLAVAHATGERFAFYGVSVFLSVIAFGGILSYLRTRDHPKLQAIAALVNGGGGTVCGLYVTETETRLYFARVNVVGGGTTAKAAPNSGRIFWVARDELTRTELGPLQSVVAAQADAADLRDEILADERRRVAATAPAGPQTGRAPATPGGRGRTGGRRAGGTPQLAGAAQRSAADLPGVSDANDCVPAPEAAPLRRTDERKLAEKFQPRLVVDRADRFWPVSALTMFRLRRGDERTCRQVAKRECPPVPRANALPWIGGVGEWLEFPGPQGKRGIDAQHEDMVSALGSPDPAKTAREYFFVTGGGDRPTSVQYWFYYQFNYQRLGIGGVPLGIAGFHEGDFEMVGVLLSRERQRPVYVWTARHAKEGRPLSWAESQLRRSRDHLTVYAARGSHATYESCARQRRGLAPHGLIDDRPQCEERRQLVLEPQITPLSDLAFAPWVCWQGNFGHSTEAGAKGLAGAAFADGPVSPLWQQRFGRDPARPCESLDAAPVRPPNGGEEVLDDGPAATLRAHGGVLDGLFDSCADWFAPPPSGVYVVACDDGALDRFFESGLEDPGDERVVLTAPDGRSRETGVPAVYRRPDADGVDGLTVSAARPTTTRLYAACYAGREPVVAVFQRVALPARARLVLRAGAQEWTLSGPGVSRSVRPRTRARSAACSGR
jgi:hypothetical protein